MDLFSQAEENKSAKPAVISVTQLTASIKALLEGGVGVVTVRGEISNWRPATSGHIYFSLKDSTAMISAALFKGSLGKIKGLQVKDGMEVICRGRISVYPPRGTYNIIVESMEPVGAGSLQAQFEALKKKLFEEGLFDPARKRPLPLIPERIVVITSPTGAAIRDVLSVLKRRFAGVKVLVMPTLVQGAEAAADILKALRLANERKLGDVILLTRGGGSLEDMWCFNDEALARGIAASEIPVVSAVGHEIDFTIADFVADLRAPTPSAAAELLVREQQALLNSAMELEARLAKAMRNEIRSFRLQLKGLASSLKNPKDRIVELRLRFDDWTERLASAAKRNVERKRDRVKRLEISLKALSPLQVLERGYSIAFAKGKALKSVNEIPKGTKFQIRLHDGTKEAEAIS